MATKIRAKLILELREQGLSRRKIAKTRRMSMESACDVYDIASMIIAADLVPERRTSQAAIII